MTANDILFRRTGNVSVTQDKNGLTANISGPVLATGVAELANLGYVPTAELLGVLSADQRKFANVVKTVKAAVKGNKDYKPMYPNFPKQVAEASDVELYLNAILHYYGDLFGVRILPEYEKEVREPIELGKLKDLGVATETDFDSIFTNLVAAKISWGTQDQEDVDWFLNSGRALVWPEVIPNKENLAYLAKHYVDPTAVIDRAATATDVLRIAVVLSGGDPAIKGPGIEKFRFKSFSKATRRTIVARLNQFKFDSLVEDMLRNKEIWKVLLHGLHVGDFAYYENVAAAAKIVRNNGHGHMTFNGRIEQAIEQGDTDRAVLLLSQRPGDFARRLDKVLRDANNKSIVLDEFRKVADKVSTPVLWQLQNFYVNRDLVARGAIERSFTAKGRSAVTKSIETSLKSLDNSVEVATRLIINEAIQEAYQSKLAVSGKVYVDPKLFDLAVPFGMRSANPALAPVGRGTRVELGDENTVRFFIWWRDQDSSGWGGRVDIDLSAVAFGANFKHYGDVGYYNLRGGWAVHSGDITSAPNGAAEFIDVDKAKALKQGVRYVAMTINSYSGQSFDALPEVYAGTMGRSKPQSGEIFEPSTVRDAFDITSPGRMNLPLVLDLVENKLIWADQNVGRVNAGGGGNAYNQRDSLTETVKSTVLPGRVKVGHVFELHFDSSVEYVDDPKKADHVFTTERGRLYLNGKIISQDEFVANWL